MRAVLWIPLLVFAGTVPAQAADSAKEASKKGWSMNATAIEACSCPDACRFLFGSKSEGQAGTDKKDQRPCRFNAAYKINSGTSGTSKLDGTKFWIFGDRGVPDSDGMMNWMVVTFDHATTGQQREAIFEIVSSLIPVSWSTFKTAVGDIEWVSDKNRTYAVLDTAKTAEVRLGAAASRTAKGAPKTIGDIKYWGSTSNTGFVMMPSAVTAVRRGGEKPFEYKGTSGFLVTFEIDSESTAAATGGGSH